MERHMSTEEVLFAGDKPIILSIANSDPYGMPQAKDVVSLLMEPGDLVVMKRGIWPRRLSCRRGPRAVLFSVL